jgi:hypothetical protein
MPALDQEYSSFSIRTLDIVFLDGSGNENTFSVRGVMEQLEITENIISPVITGSIVIKDTSSISRIVKTGSAFLRMSLSKFDDKFLYEKTARIYKQERRKLSNQTSEKFILYFCSEEMILSEQSRVSRGYTDTYSNIAKNIFTDFLEVSQDKISISESNGVKNTVVPSLKPFDALYWCANRAVNSKDIPDFLFFENKEGFNFSSMDDLFSQESFNILFTAKNTVIDGENKEGFIGAKSSEIGSQFNLLENIKKGTYASTIYGYDLITGTMFRQEIANKYYDKRTKLNSATNIPYVSNKKRVMPDNAFESKRMMVVTDSQFTLSKYTQRKAVTTKLQSPEFSLAHRTALLTFISTKRSKVLLPGNFGLTIGMLVNLKFPKRGKVGADEQLDYTSSGKHLIVAVRHVIDPSKHETVIEVCSDSDLEEGEV